MPLLKADHTPRHVGSIRFAAAVGDSELPGAELPPLPEGELLLDLTFETRGFPFEDYCRYVRLTEGETRRVFAKMVFSATPPGERVGPWPGWRGIPEMPAATLRQGPLASNVRFQFQGDEERSERLHGLCTLPGKSDRWISVDSGHHALIPLSAEVYCTNRPRAVPQPLNLRPELRDTHPRLLITRADLSALKLRAPQSRAWKEMLALLPCWDLPPELTTEAKTPEGPERLRGEDRVMLAAAMALVDPSAENRQRARDAYHQYLSDTSSPGYEPLQIDTQAGETLFVLALGYDWLHGHLTAAEQQRAREWLFAVAERCWSYLGYERRDYAQAHYLGCALGVLAFSVVFWDDHPRAREWAEYLAGVLELVCSMLPDDGFYPHGINLWIYEYGFLLRWLEIFRISAGRDLWNISEHWKNASRFRGSVTSPDGLLAFTFGDPQYRVSGDAWMHMLIGSRTGEKAATRLGNFLEQVSHQGVDFRATPPRRRVYELLYGDQRIEEPQGPPQSVEVFPDGSQISVRSSEVLFCFRAGPPIGQTRYAAGEFGGYGHADPSHGGFLLLFRGRPIVCGPGPVYRRETAHHSLPTVDGLGQVGDSCVWLPEFFPPSRLPPLPEVMVRGSRVALHASLGPAYLPGSGIASAERSLYVDPERCIVGSDRIGCDRSRMISWNLSTRYPVIHQAGTAGTLFRLGPPEETAVELAVMCATPHRWWCRPAPVVPGYTNDGAPLFTLIIQTEAESLELLWCLSLDSHPVADYTYSGGTEWTIRGKDGLTIRRHNQWIFPEGFDAYQA